MTDRKDLDPGHQQVQGTLRVVGLTMMVVGGLFTVVGIGNFLMVFASFGSGGFEFPRYFWCAFVGLPLFGFGMQIAGLGFMGRFFRYTAGEAAPVSKDTFNYLADGTSPGVRALAEAVGQGFAAGARGGEAHAGSCPKCQASNAATAQFCSQCGTMLGPKTCPRCSAPNDPDSRFCSQCGGQVT